MFFRFGSSSLSPISLSAFFYYTFLAKNRLPPKKTVFLGACYWWLYGRSAARFICIGCIGFEKTLKENEMPRTVCLMAFSYEGEEEREMSQRNFALAIETKNAYRRFLLD